MCEHYTNVVHWRLARQTNVADGTVVAEAAAYCECIRDVQWFRHLCEDIGCPQQVRKEDDIFSSTDFSLSARGRDTKEEGKGAITATKVYQDNAGLRKGIQDGGDIKALKHFDVKDKIIYTRYNAGIVLPVQIAGTDNPADVFTKPLPKPAFTRFRDIIMGVQRRTS